MVLPAAVEDEITHAWTAQVVVGAVLANDVFLVLGGFFAGHSFLVRLKAVNRKSAFSSISNLRYGCIDVPRMYASRLVRILPTYGAVLGWLITISGKQTWRDAGPLKTSNTDFVALLLPRQIEPRSVAQCVSRKRREPMQKIVVEQHHVDQQHFSIDGRQRQQRLVFRQSVHGKTLLFFPSGVFSKWCFSHRLFFPSVIFLSILFPLPCLTDDT